MRDNSWGLRHLAFAAGLGLAAGAALLWGMAIVTPITASGTAYLVGLTLVAVGGLTAIIRPHRSILPVVAGLLLIVGTIGVRLGTNRNSGPIRLTTLPANAGTRWINRLVHERDLGLIGQRIAGLTGIGLSRREYDGLTEALATAYASMTEAGGTTSSPTFSTYLFLQRPTAFDAVIVEPPPGASPRSAVIYLHGFAGNFTVQGWLVGQAARRLNMLTVCPSVGFIGNWWSPQGEQTLRNTIRYCRDRGIERIYVAGLSNGGVGLCRLAPRFRHDLAGIVLISGADPRTPEAGLPVLALHGADDERMPAASARAYVEQAGDRGTYREFDGDHLLLAKRADEVQAALEAWLREQEDAANSAMNATD